MITITVKDGNIYFKSEYNRDIVQFMRSRPKRFWNTNTREWVLPESDMELLLSVLSGLEYDVKYEDSKNAITDSMPDWYEFKTKPYEHQIEGVNYGLHHPKFLLADEQGLGKALALDTKVYTPYGYKLMRDIHVGDYVFNKQGNPVRVLATYDNKNVNMCRITFSDGAYIDCCEDHLWEIYEGKERNIVDTKWFFEKNNNICIDGVYRYHIDLCKPVNFNSMYTNINPYMYGVEIPLSNGIPIRLMYNSVGIRFNLLRGVFDRFAEIKNGEIVCKFDNYRTAEDIQWVAQSLGFISVSDFTSGKYIISVRGNNLQELLTDKKKKSLVQPCFAFRNIERVERIGKADAKCITVDDEDGLYLIDHFIVTHNTKQMLDLSQILKKEKQIKHTLIIACVNSLKYNWQAEVGIHTNDNCFILGTRYTKTGREYIGSNEDRLADINSIGKGGNIDNCFYLITNIETLRYNKSIKVPLKTKKNGVQRFKKQTVFPVVDALQQQIKDGNISMIIADESHRCKDSSSLQGRALLALDCDYKVALTGTPVMNNPVDIYTTLNWLGFEHHSLFAFKKHYCIMGGFGQHQIVGYKNLPELQAILDKCMLRRLKADVLDLPEKIHINDYVEMTKDQIKLYDEVRNYMVQNIDKIKLSPNPLVQLIRLRQVTGNPSLLSSSIKGNPKLDRMLEIVEEVVENNGKCLVFSNWTNILDPAFELLAKNKFNPALYTGQNKDTRESEKDRFMKDDSCKVLLGTMDAMGTGLTLTAANTVIFLDDPWNRAKKDQCEDRVHRIGTKESPNIITIMCKGTIDERINDLVCKKGKMSDILIDKEEDLMKNPKIVNYLLQID